MLRNQAGPRWGSQFSHLERLPTAQDTVMNQPLKYFSRLTQCIHISLLLHPFADPFVHPHFEANIQIFSQLYNYIIKHKHQLNISARRWRLYIIL